ncbi:hypothetical protein GCM10011418_45340 [Sphingobacterium alkalisoli]|nr:hypothetical protein GCM10011418_45340 [Sphingobacterium alkalisoli]
MGMVTAMVMATEIPRPNVIIYRMPPKKTVHLNGFFSESVYSQRPSRTFMPVGDSMDHESFIYG